MFLIFVFSCSHNKFNGFLIPVNNNCLLIFDFSYFIRQLLKRLFTHVHTCVSTNVRMFVSSMHEYVQIFRCTTNMFVSSMYIDLSVAVYSYLFVCGRQYFKQNEMFNQFPKSQNRKDEDEKKNIKKFKPVGLLLVRQTHRLFSLIWWILFPHLALCTSGVCRSVCLSAWLSLCFSLLKQNKKPQRKKQQHLKISFFFVFINYYIKESCFKLLLIISSLKRSLVSNGY